MRRFSYEGDKGEVVLYGVTFPKSEPVAVDPAAHPVLVRKLEGNSHFREHADGDEQGDEVATLRSKLDELGIKYHHKAGAEKLRALLPE
jgi:hypothetical protein